MGKDSTKPNPPEKNSAKKSKGMALQVVTDKQIESNQIPKDQLWYISVKGEAVGPFLRDDVRVFLEEHPTFPRDTKVANYVHQVWLPLFKIPEFQRRRPQLLSRTEDLGNNEFYLLHQGQKAGPFTLEAIENKLEEKTLLVSDLVSIDHGETWMKIYEFPHFDRRNRLLRDGSATPLPSPPQDDFFARSPGPELLQLHAQAQEARDEEEGLIGLAYIGKLRSKTLQSNHPTAEDHQGHEERTLHLHELTQNSGAMKKYIKYLLLVLFLGLASGGLYYYKMKLDGHHPAGPEKSSPELEEKS